MSFELKIIKLSSLPPAESFLTERESAFYQTLQFPKRRTEWLGGRFALKSLVLSVAAGGKLKSVSLPFAKVKRANAKAADLTCLHPVPLTSADVKPADLEPEDFKPSDLKQIEVLPQSSGKPVLLLGGKEALFPFSITHSNGYAAAALSADARYLGLDLEKTEHRIAAWATNFFHPSELLAQEDVFLTTLWTQKEALVKLLGTGLSLNSFDIRITHCVPSFYGAALEIYQKMGSPVLTLQTIPAPAGFVLCIALGK